MIIQLLAYVNAIMTLCITSNTTDKTMHLKVENRQSLTYNNLQAVKSMVRADHPLDWFTINNNNR